MKKLLALILVPCLLLGSMLMLSGCSRRVSYENEEMYSVGAFASDEKIRAVEIYWDGRGVSVSAAFTDKITAVEDYEKSNGKAMRCAVEDGVLKIYPCASGKRVGKLAKTLFVDIPVEIMNSLSSVKICAVEDTKVNLQMVNAAEVSVVAQDGNVSIEGSMTKVTVETEKGNLNLKSATVGDLDFTSIIGNANLYLHLQGFTAVMRGETGSFTTSYNVSENNRLYTYATGEALLTFTTEGKVDLRDYDIAG
ncbi:MAG: DUF4097 domain-containing protein [Ruminococcaceae bacterium]|nr:DUF4097 domain-containing protein [Oscillospiraceae bacterium]